MVNNFFPDFFSFSLLCVPCLCGSWCYPGEILKLNPSYKAPPDYKPLLKEARVPIPVSHIRIVAFCCICFLISVFLG